MVIETEQIPFWEWFGHGLLFWLLIAGGLAAGVLLVSWLVAALRNGPRAATGICGGVLAAAAADMVRISPRRVWALSWLAVRDSIRRRVVIVFVVFVLIILFAGWYLDPGSRQPARLYIGFVLTATGYLVVLLALFLSALSLPGDIKSKTLHTVVTKPVRPSEIVLGRIIGFGAVGTVLLFLMGTVSYVFVVRGLSHTHELELTEDDLNRMEKAWATQLADGQSPRTVARKTSRVHNHRHTVAINPAVPKSETGAAGGGLHKEVRARTSTQKGHWHELSYKISIEQLDGRKGPKITCELGELGPPQGGLVARVPVYGKLSFTDSAGRNKQKGVNVGDEWEYRSYIRGGTLATAIWTFEDITPGRFPRDKFPNGLPLEMGLEVFRTYKGKTDDPDKIPPIPGSLSVRNPRTDLTVDVGIFEAKEYTTEVQYIPFELETDQGRKVDLFEDLIARGRLEIRLRCVQPNQYFGFAEHDVYLRARDASFTLNFAKGYLGIWLQMVLVIGVGVMLSTFLSAPIALLATLGVITGGLCSNFMRRLALSTSSEDFVQERVYGGGPLESLIRLGSQQNITEPMEPGLSTTMAKMTDLLLAYPLWLASQVLPPLGEFSYSDYVAYGFDVSADTMLRCVIRALGFMVPLFVAGYFFLKTREVGR